MTARHLSASFSATLRVRVPDSPGSFARLAQAIGDAGGLLGAIDLVRVEKGFKVRDVTVEATDADHLHADRGRGPQRRGRRGRARLRPDVPPPPRGQDRDAPEVPVSTRDDLSMAYTPGVARICPPSPPTRTVWALTSSRTPSRSSPTAPPCSGSATSAPRRRCP